MNKNEVIRCCDSPMFVLKTADFIKCQKGIFDNNQQNGDLECQKIIEEKRR